MSPSRGAGRRSAGGEEGAGPRAPAAPGAGGGALLGFVLVLPGAHGRWCWFPGLAPGLRGPERVRVRGVVLAADRALMEAVEVVGQKS